MQQKYYIHVKLFFHSIINVLFIIKRKVPLFVLPLTDHENGEERSLLGDRHNQLNEGKQT